MHLKVSLVPTGVGDGYRLALQTGPRKTYEAFLRHCEKSSTLSHSDVEAVLRHAADWVADSAVEGKECDLGPLGRSRLGMKGRFKKRPQRISDKDVKLTISWTLPRAMKDLVGKKGNQLVRKRVVAKPKDAIIALVRSFNADQDGWQDNAWQAGATLHLSGQMLKFDRDKSDEGVFLVPVKSGKAVRLKSYIEVFPKNVRAVVPKNLAGSGRFKVEVRRRANPGSGDVSVSHYGRTLAEL